VVAAGDNQVRVFEVSSGKCLLTIREIGKSARSLLLSPDGQRVVVRVGGERPVNSFLQTYSLADGRLLQTLKPTEPVTYYDLHDVDQSPNGRLLVAGAYDKSIKVWKAEPATDLEKEAMAVLETLSTDPASALANKDDQSELGWLRSAVSGDAEAAELGRVARRNAEQQALLEEGRRNMHERLAAKETGPGSPRTVAESIIKNSAAIKDATFVSYAIGLKEYQTLPARKDALLNVNYDFTYVTKGGLIAQKRGSVTVQWERTLDDVASGDPNRGRWIPINVNIGGQDHPIR